MLHANQQFNAGYGHHSVPDCIAVCLARWAIRMFTFVPRHFESEHGRNVTLTGILLSYDVEQTFGHMCRCQRVYGWQLHRAYTHAGMHAHMHTSSAQVTCGCNGGRLAAEHCTCWRASCAPGADRPAGADADLCACIAGTVCLSCSDAHAG